MDRQTRRLVTLLSHYATATQAAALLGVSRPRLQQLVGDGRLKVAVVFGGLRLFRRTDVTALAAVARSKGTRLRTRVKGGAA